MQNAIANAFGDVAGVAIFGSILTLIAMVFGKIIGKPLNRAQISSIFMFSCVVSIVVIIFLRCSS